MYLIFLSKEKLISPKNTKKMTLKAEKNVPKTVIKCWWE